MRHTTGTLLKWGKYRVDFAYPRAWHYMWCWRPEKTLMWMGKLIYWSWGPFDVVVDNRGDQLDLLSDMTNRSREELEARLRDISQTEKETNT